MENSKMTRMEMIKNKINSLPADSISNQIISLYWLNKIEISLFGINS
jgi:hypothetical protein